MFWWAKELLSALSFLFVRGDRSLWQSKRVYEFFIPIFLTVFLFAIYIIKPNFFTTNLLEKLSSSLFQFMVFVVPFHLAALAAIATFNRKGLDQPLKGVSASLRVWDNSENSYVYKTLSLRQYTCLLFGYLCTIGIFFIIVFVVASGINVEELFGIYSHLLEKISVFFLILFLFHYSILSVYAISFLFDKVNETRT